MSVTIDSPLADKLDAILSIKESIRDAAGIEEGVPFDGFAAIIEELKNATGGGAGNIEYERGEFEIDNNKISTTNGEGSFSFNYNLSKPPKLILCFQNNYAEAVAHFAWHVGFIYTNRVAVCFRGTSGSNPSVIGPTNATPYDNNVTTGNAYNQVNINTTDKLVEVTKLYSGWRSGIYTWEAYTWTDEDAAESRIGKKAIEILNKTVTEVTEQDIEDLSLSGSGRSNQYMFQNSSTLKKFIGPNFKMGYATFQNCTALEEVVIGWWDAYATSGFDGCTALKKVVAKNGVAIRANSMFNNCTSLKILDFRDFGGVIILDNADTFKSLPSDFKIIVKDELVTQYKAATNWSNYAANIISVLEYENNGT